MNQFCDKCGSVIDQETGDCPVCAEEVTRCIEPIDADQLPAEFFGEPKPEKPKIQKEKIRNIVAIVVVIAVLIGMIVIDERINENNIFDNGYNEIIEAYKRVISGEDDNSNNNLSEELINKLKEDENYEICYTIDDINVDETNELIIGGRLAGDEDAEIYDIYTVDNQKKAVQLFDVNNFSKETEIRIYNEAIKVSEEKENYSHIEYHVLSKNSSRLQKLEEYLFEDGKYFEVNGESKTEITKEDFDLADKKYENSETDLDWVKVKLDNDSKDKGSTADATESTTTKVFDGKKYIGTWGSHYLANGIYDYTLDIKSVDGNKLTMDVSFYRIVGYENQTVTVDENGIAHFKMPDEASSFLSGTMKFSDNTIDMIFDDFADDWYKGKRFVFEKIGGASPNNIYQYLGKDLKEITKLFGNGITEYWMGGKFMQSEEVDALFFYTAYEQYVNVEKEEVLMVMCSGDYDYGYGLSGGKTYAQLKASTSKYFDLPKPIKIEWTEDMLDETGMNYYITFTYDKYLIGVEWANDPYTTGANWITFQFIPEGYEDMM